MTRLVPPEGGCQAPFHRVVADVGTRVQELHRRPVGLTVASLGSNDWRRDVDRPLEIGWSHRVAQYSMHSAASFLDYIAYKYETRPTPEQLDGGGEVKKLPETW
jgi:hypothetical protein